MAGAERAVGLAIMAKAPRVGAVKTRLCPPLRAPEAAELARCFLLALGLQAALVIGTDSPTLPRESLDEAVSLVMARDVDVVLGPTRDGGYYLIGMRALHPGLFEHMPWSTAAVLGRTLDRAQRLGLRVACLPTWFDVDTGADLERLRVELDASPAGPPRHTRAFLAGRVANHELHTPDGGGAAASRSR